MTTVNLNTVTWEDAPLGYDQSGTLYNIKLATIGGYETILALDLNTHKASMTMATDHGPWAHTTTTQDWPVFDRVFDRAHWQSWLAEWETETAALLKEDLGANFVAYYETDAGDSHELDFSTDPQSPEEAYEDIDAYLEENMASVTNHGNGRWSVVDEDGAELRVTVEER